MANDEQFGLLNPEQAVAVARAVQERQQLLEALKQQQAQAANIQQQQLNAASAQNQTPMGPVQ
jgi:hypothetical protein